MVAWKAAPNLRTARAGLDWCNLLFDRPISRERWRELASTDALDLETDKGALKLLRSGRVRPDADSIAWGGDGLLVRAVSPERYAVEREHHAARVDVQGLWCSTSHDGLTAVEQARSAVEQALWPGVSVVPCVAGRMDLFADIEVEASQEDGSVWVEREVFRSGNMDACWKHFTTRAKEASRKANSVIDVVRLREGLRLTDEEKALLEAQMKSAELGQFLGGARVGRSRVLGRDPRLLTYEADRDPSRDKALVKDRWRAAGWDGARRVVRTEIRVSRDWFTDNELELENGERIRLAGEGGLSWDEVRPLLPAIARTLLLRTRETDVRDKGRVLKRRRHSPLWAANLRAHDEWSQRLRDGEQVDWEGAPAILARRRLASLEKATRRAESGFTEAWVHALQSDPLCTLADVAYALGSAAYDGQALTPMERLQEKAHRVAMACGYPEPPKITWQPSNRAQSEALLRALRMTPAEVQERIRAQEQDPYRPLEAHSLGWKRDDYSPDESP